MRFHDDTAQSGGAPSVPDIEPRPVSANIDLVGLAMCRTDEGEFAGFTAALVTHGLPSGDHRIEMKAHVRDRLEDGTACMMITAELVVAHADCVIHPDGSISERALPRRRRATLIVLGGAGSQCPDDITTLFLRPGAPLLAADASADAVVAYLRHIIQACCVPQPPSAAGMPYEDARAIVEALFIAAGRSGSVRVHVRYRTEYIGNGVDGPFTDMIDRACDLLEISAGTVSTWQHGPIPFAKCRTDRIEVPAPSAHDRARAESTLTAWAATSREAKRIVALARVLGAKRALRA